ncbi:hypothetical protein K458DRAFT_413297 [Lentithecium fluviatile CBS 122367]|uniref:Metal tolerance protein 3 n=1 Tax=Lentithecium fluviatile CBS 122367 TaxID=1168545 RepID=A0A6G1JIY8_9PLEO|nr:hypothetical protein K458DRAFT_413297 [Lentithecium fluviatile CBS 122367]
MQLFASLLVLLSVFQLAVAAPEKYPAAELVVRQATTAATTPTTTCFEYSTIANMSVIGTNSSYRSAFLQKSPVGTIINARMLNAAMLKLPALTANAALNTQCGNLTTVATTEAANNFTAGIVAQFTTAGLPVGIKNGLEVIISVLASCVIMSGVWIFSS